MDTWTLRDAKGELATVARRALEGTPQVVRLGDGDAAVVVVDHAAYERLAEPSLAAPAGSPLSATSPDAAPRPGSGAELIAFLRSSPLAEAVAAGEFDLDALRDRDYGQGVDLG